MFQSWERIYSRGGEVCACSWLSGVQPSEGKRKEARGKVNPARKTFVILHLHYIKETVFATAASFYVIE